MARGYSCTLADAPRRAGAFVAPVRPVGPHSLSYTLFFVYRFLFIPLSFPSFLKVTFYFAID
jgi:hypothetical protein